MYLLLQQHGVNIFFYNVDSTASFWNHMPSIQNFTTEKAQCLHEFKFKKAPS
jgi:hypothetical protein